MDQLALDILSFIKKEYESENTGAMELEGVKTKNTHLNEEISDERFLTEVDKKTLLVHKSKLKNIKLSYNDICDFSNSKVTVLQQQPEDLVKELNERYELNYLNVSQDDKIRALKNRYEKYEEVMKDHLAKNYKIHYQRVHLNQLSSENKVVIIGFAKTTEEDAKIKSDDFLIDCLDPNGEAYSLSCFFDFQEYSQQGFEREGIQLFPMKLLTMSGVITDEHEFKILQCFSTPSYENVPIVNQTFMSHHEILCFAGPYSLDSSTFTAFDPILYRINEFKPSLVILVGPFYDQAHPVSQEPCYTNHKGVDVEFDFINRRNDQLKHLIETIKSQTMGCTKIAIVPDINEIDCMFPLPIPNAVLNFHTYADIAQVYSNPALISLDNGLKIAVTGGDIFLDLAKSSTYENGVNNRFLKGLESFLEQKNLLPIYPCISPVDLSKVDLTSYSENEQPDILIARSQITQQLVSVRGVVCLTIQPAASSNEFKSYGHFKVANIDKVSVILFYLNSYIYRKESLAGILKQ